jgi:3-methylcrotonyl-CoA carboxylase alpha subunit
VRLVLDDDTRDVSIRPSKQGADVVIAGRTLRLGLRPLGGGSFLLEHAGRLELFHCVLERDTVHLFWNGRPYELRLEREGARTAQRAVAGGLEAPMPGRVIKISVAVGQQVRKGDEILVIEAMKMENLMRAPKDGRVVRLSAQVGDMVNPGVVLVEIE